MKSFVYLLNFLELFAHTAPHGRYYFGSNVYKHDFANVTRYLIIITKEISFKLNSGKDVSM